MERVSIEIVIPTDNDGDIVFKSLKPEVETLHSKRTKVKMENLGDKLRIDINASDITAARAAVNSFIRLLDIALGVKEVVRSGV